MPIKEAAIAAPGPLTRFYFFLADPEHTLRGDDIEKFKLLRDALRPICTNQAQSVTAATSTPTPTLPAVIDTYWERIFAYETPKEDQVYEFKNVPNIKQLYEQYRSTTNAGYVANPVAISILEQCAHLSAVEKSTSLNLTKIVFGYIAQVALSIMSTSVRDAKLIHTVFQHLQTVIAAIYTRQDLCGCFGAEEFNLLRSWHTELLPQHIANTTPVPDEIPGAVNQLAAQTQNLTTYFLRALHILTEGGNKKNLSIAPQAIAEYPFNESNPIAHLMQLVARFLPTLDNPERSFNFNEYQPPSLQAYITYLQNNCAEGTAFGDFRRASHPVHYLLLQETVTQPNQQTVVRWAGAGQVSQIEPAARMLQRLSSWMAGFAFLAHGMRHLYLLLSYKGQQVLHCESVSAFVKRFLTWLTTMLDRLEQDIQQDAQYLAARKRHDEGEYDHDILHIFSQITLTIHSIRTNAIIPLTQLDRTVATLRQLAIVAAEQFQEVQQRLQLGGFFPDLPPLNATPALEAQYPRERRAITPPSSQLTPVPHDRRLLDRQATSPFNHTAQREPSRPFNHTAQRRLEPSREEGLLPFFHNNDGFPLTSAMLPGLSHHTSPFLQSNSKALDPASPARLHTAQPTLATNSHVMPLHQHAGNEEEADDEAFDSVRSFSAWEQTHVPLKKKRRWKQALGWTLSFTLLTFILFIVLMNTSAIAVPSFLIGLSLVAAAFSFAGIIALSVLALGLFITFIMAEMDKTPEVRRRTPSFVEDQTTPTTSTEYCPMVIPSQAEEVYTEEENDDTKSALRGMVIDSPSNAGILHMDPAVFAAGSRTSPVQGTDKTVVFHEPPPPADDPLDLLRAYYKPELLVRLNQLTPSERQQFPQNVKQFVKNACVNSNHVDIFEASDHEKQHIMLEMLEGYTTLNAQVLNLPFDERESQQIQQAIREIRAQNALSSQSRFAATAGSHQPANNGRYEDQPQHVAQRKQHTVSPS